jgi:prepilin-type N-terminal cleavage/methylation domain-containing protein
MKRVKKYHKQGFTFIEVLISMIIILLIVIGVMSYMYACAWNARVADVRITATRVGQLLLETWKLTGHTYIEDGKEKWAWNVIDFDPTDAYFNSSLSYSFGESDVTFTEEPIGTELGDYQTKIDGKTYFVTLSYQDDNPYMLSARVAWSGHIGPGDTADNLQWVDVTSYAIY